MENQYIQIEVTNDHIAHIVLEKNTNMVELWNENLRKFKREYNPMQDQTLWDAIGFVNDDQRIGTLEDTDYDEQNDFEYGYRFEKAINDQNQMIITGSIWARFEDRYDSVIEKVNKK